MTSAVPGAVGGAPLYLRLIEDLLEEQGIDIEAAAKELRDVYEIDTRQDLEDLDHDTYWAIIRKHDATQQSWPLARKDFTP